MSRSIRRFFAFAGRQVRHGLRNTWRKSDVVGRFVVFDISHNRCRLIAPINYKWRKVYIRHILSHTEYDKMDWQSS